MKTLRKIGFIILSVMMFVNLTACSDDDDDEIYNSTIIGKWELINDKGYEIYDEENMNGMKKQAAHS